MVCKQAWATLWAINLFAFAEGAETISGRVVGGAGPVAGVKVALKAAGSISATTGADGLFELNIPSNGVLPGGPSLPDFSIRNHRMELRLAARENVAIGIYSTAGKLEKEVWHRSLAAGEYAIPLHEPAAGLPSGLYLVRVSIGSSGAAAKIVVAEGAVRSLDGDGPRAGLPALTKSGAGDSLVFTKTGFFPKQVPLPSLATQNLGDVLVVQDKIGVGSAREDAYDQILLESTARYALDESVAMVIKAMIVIESTFNPQAISMWDSQLPCGTHSYGLIQVTPGCISGYASLPGATPVTATISGGLNGEPPVLTYANPADKAAGNTVVRESNIIINLVSNPANPFWPNSGFNPAYNLDYGTKTLAGVRSEMKSRFPSCTNANYVSMALAGYNQGSGTVSGCTSFSQGGQNYVNSVLGQYRQFCQRAGIPAVY